MPMLTSAAMDGTEVAPSRVLAVMRASGLSLVSYDERAALELRCPELVLLEELARSGPASTDDTVRAVATRAGIDRTPLFAFVGELQARGMVPRGAATPAGGSEAVRGSVDSFVLGDDDVRRRALTPFVFWLSEGGFDLLDHDGLVILRLGAVELVAATEFYTARHHRSCIRTSSAHGRSAGARRSAIHCAPLASERGRRRG